MEAHLAKRKEKAGVTEQERARELMTDQLTQLRYKSRETEAAKAVTDLNARLAALTRQRNDSATDTKKLETELAALLLEKEQKAAEFQAQQQERESRIEATLEELKRVRERSEAERHAGFVELTLHGKDRNFEFAIKETDATGKEIGTAVVREPKMLTKLLTRIKNDPTAPKQLRVVADPSLSLNGHFTVGLKACETAGFKTVTFTGYMPKQVLRIPALKSDHKGDAPGYKRYDAVERDTASLIKEVEDWMRTW
jgi:hypothetical protein